MQPRLILPGAKYMVTRRTLLRHHLMKPDPEVTGAFIYLLAVLAPRHGILVHAAVLLSTHYHLTLTDTLGRLPRFTAELNRLMAHIVKVLRKWDGPLWDERQPSYVELLTPEAFIRETGYSIANPVEAGAVERAAQWPGLVTLPAQLGVATLEATRPTVYLDQKSPQWPERAELALTLPEDLPWDDDETRRLVAADVERREYEAAEAREAKGRKATGAKRVLALSPYRRATSQEPIRGRNPTFAVGRGNRSVFFAAVQRLRTFRRRYREALRRFREGIRDVLFPEGTYAMVVIHGVATAPG